MLGNAGREAEESGSASPSRRRPETVSGVLLVGPRGTNGAEGADEGEEAGSRRLEGVSGRELSEELLLAASAGGEDSADEERAGGWGMGSRPGGNVFCAVETLEEAMS